LLLIHYWFPVGLGWSVALVIHQATGLPIVSSGLHLYLFGICAAYSLDRLVDNVHSSRPTWLTTVLTLGFLFSAIAGIFLALRLSIQTFSALILFSVITLLYTQIKKLPFVKGLVVAVVWGWAGVALPFANHHWFAWQFWTTQVSLPLVLLVACGVILCDFKDVKSDIAFGVRSLPAMLGLSSTMWIVSILLVVVGVISFAENRMGLVVSSVLLLLLTQFPRILALDAFGPLIVDAFLTIPGVLIVLHFIF
jgi:4-hydroxybenzoate polyprenyltransferase